MSEPLTRDELYQFVKKVAQRLHPDDTPELAASKYLKTPEGQQAWAKMERLRRKEEAQQ